jgi:hypothetical protein
MSGTDFVYHQALEASGQDGNEGNLDESDEVLRRPLKDRVQPPVIGYPREGAFHHPANSGRKEFSVPTAGDRLDGDAECLAGAGQPLAAGR